MNRDRILIQIGDEEVEATLLWEEAPNICRAIRDNLPMESEAHLAKICNHEIIIMLPMRIEQENMQPVSPGDVGWWDIRSAINIWFDDPGPSGPLGPTARFARITRNLEGLSRVARRIWERADVPVRLSRAQ